MRTLLLAWLLFSFSNTSYAAVTITTPTVNSGELIRASDWNKVRTDLLSLSTAVDILGYQVWNFSGQDLYYLNGKVGIGTDTFPAHFSIHKASPTANEKLFQIGTGADADKANIDEDGDLQIDGTLLVRGGTIYDSNGALELNGEDNVYLSMDWNNDDNDNRALVIGKNAAGPGGNWAELMRVTETGRVGIGTATPGLPLHVLSPDNTGHTLRLQSSNGGSHFTDFVKRPSSYGAPNALSIYNNDGTNWYHGLSIAANGNVGLGTESPNAKLNVSGIIMAGRALGAAPAGSLDDNQFFSIFNNDKAGDQRILDITTDSNNTAILRSVATDMALVGGNVGIGTADPDNKLEIRGGNIEVENNDADSQIRFHDPWNAWYSVGLDQSDNHKFKINVGGGVGENTHFTLDGGNGYIGLGTATPSATLDIGSGGLRVREGIINKAGLASGTDLGLYSEGGSNWIRLVSNAGDIRFYVDGAAGNSYYGGTPSMTVAHTGNVGIGTTAPSQKLDVEGTVLATDFVYSSDKRLKKDILKIKNPIKIIQQLEGVKFKWNNSDKNSIGFIAQDVERVLPELVETSEVDGLKSVRYGNINAILVEALKEMKELTDQQQKLIENQQEQINKLKEVMNL